MPSKSICFQSVNICDTGSALCSTVRAACKQKQTDKSVLNLRYVFNKMQFNSFSLTKPYYSTDSVSNMLFKKTSKSVGFTGLKKQELRVYQTASETFLKI